MVTCHGKMKTEIRAMEIQAKDRQQTTRSQGGRTGLPRKRE